MGTNVFLEKTEKKREKETAGAHKRVCVCVREGYMNDAYNFS